ncbi:hypothetical protein [Streptomyces sp. 7N604]|uniref:hypothetical protein n=1 Tax=Streptomyces sp. 7N604 TaxID=3457415 RepID=UPI003FD1B6C3
MPLSVRRTLAAVGLAVATAVVPMAGAAYATPSHSVTAAVHGDHAKPKHENKKKCKHSKDKKDKKDSKHSKSGYKHEKADYKHDDRGYGNDYEKKHVHDHDDYDLYGFGHLFKLFDYDWLRYIF